MALPSLRTSNLPNISESEAAATNSPARGKEMRTNLLQKLRSPPLVHAWEFWHDRQDRKRPAPTPSASHSTSSIPTLSSLRNATSGDDPAYEDRLVLLSTIADIKDFWEVFNNFEFGSLPLRDSVHLFHKGVKPVWEDARNVRGGAWTFRVPKEKAAPFWKEVCLMAIGEQLQEAVKSKRITFIDDICGISLSVRFTSTLITIWNRDADHAAGIAAILQTVLSQLPPELAPKESSYYYKKHSEHAGFRIPIAKESLVMDGEGKEGIGRAPVQARDGMGMPDAVKESAEQQQQQPGVETRGGPAKFQGILGSAGGTSGLEEETMMT